MKRLLYTSLIVLFFGAIAKLSAAPMVLEVMSMEQFETELQNSKVPTFVDFYATWCGPCNRLTPFVENWAGMYQGKIRFLKINVDTLPLLSQQYQIRSMPTMLLFTKEGKLADRKVGYDIYQLMNHLEKRSEISSSEIEALIQESLK